MWQEAGLNHEPRHSARHRRATRSTPPPAGWPSSVASWGGSTWAFRCTSCGTSWTVTAAAILDGTADLLCPVCRAADETSRRDR